MWDRLAGDWGSLCGTDWLVTGKPMWDRLAGDWGSLCGTDWLVTEEAYVGQTGW